MRNNNTSKLVTLAILIAVTFVLGWFTKVPILGGYFTLLDAGIFTTAFLLGKREALIVGALAGFLNDFLAGYAAYMFFTLVIHGAQGYFGAFTKNKFVNYLISGIIMVGGYFIADLIISHSFGTAIFDLWVNGVQTTAGFVIALAVAKIIQKSGILNGFIKA